MADYTGRSGKRYTLGTVIKHGGEGTVYEVAGNPSLVAKVFFDKKFKATKYDPDRRQSMQAKVNAMLDHPIRSSDFAWPQDSLRDGNGRFVGYVMPKVSGTSLFDAEQPLLRPSVFTKYNYRYSVILAYNLAIMVERAHDAGYIIGDMNPANIMLRPNCSETIIDTDSFNVRDRSSNKVYKCEVVYPGFVAPEHVSRNMENPANMHTEHSDDFILAIHCFVLLCEGQHPFACKMPKKATGSSSVSTTDSKIAQGLCPFVTKPQRGIKIPDNTIDIASLPSYIRELFDRAFTYTAATGVQQTTQANRPTAREWRAALKRLLDDLEQSGTTCHANKEHRYLTSYGRCPFCAMNSNKKIRPANKGTALVKTPIGNTNGTGANSWKQHFTNKTAAYAARRSAVPLYLLNAVTALAASPLLGSYYARVIEMCFEHSVQQSTGTIGIAIIGVLTSLLFSFMVQDSFCTAVNPWPYALLALCVPPLTIFIGGLGTAILAIAYWIFIGLVQIVIACIILLAFCSGASNW